MVWYSHLFKNFPQFVVIHTVKDFSVVNEADFFLKFSFFFYDLVNIDHFISGSSASSEFSLYIWKFSIYVLLKPSLKDFEHYLASIHYMFRNISLPYFVNYNIVKILLANCNNESGLVLVSYFIY